MNFWRPPKADNAPPEQWWPFKAPPMKNDPEVRIVHPRTTKGPEGPPIAQHRKV